MLCPSAFQFLARIISLAILLATATTGVSAFSQGTPLPPEDPHRELSLILRKLDRTARLLYVTAHPDDEDSGLVARLTHGEGVEVVLMTLTRGEGGQNEIGTELFDALGVLRSRELQAASRYAGFRQLHSRAFEFGYSFSIEETYEEWGEEEIVRDIVQVIRAERPDVVLTMLDAGPGGGQHHQASARLATTAYEVAATDQWPELGPPHQPSRLFRQIWSEDSPHVAYCVVDLGIYDTILGDTYQGIGLASRAMHKCQGMAQLTDPIPTRLSRWHWAKAEGEAIGEIGHFFDRLPEPLLDDGSGPTELGRALRTAAKDVQDSYDPENALDLVPALLRYHDLVETAEQERKDPASRLRLATLRLRAARAIQLATGIRIEARSTQQYVAPGSALTVEVSMYNGSRAPVSIEPIWTGAGMSGVTAVVADGEAPPFDLDSRQRTEVGFHLSVDPGAEPTLPFAMPHHGRAVKERDPATIKARYLDPRWTAFAFAPRLGIDGRAVTIPPIPVLFQGLDSKFPNVFYSDVHLVPDPSVRIPEARVAIPVSEGDRGRTRIEVLVSSLDGGPVEVALRCLNDDDVNIDPATQTVETRPGGAEVATWFDIASSGHQIPITGPLPLAALEAEARYPGRERRPSHSGYQRVTYPHIRPGSLHLPARSSLVAFPCESTSRRIGYIEGSGDQMLPALRRLGYDPVVLGPEDLDRDLSAFDVIITGVRVYKVREDVKDAQPRLMKWVENGGTLLVQYNKFEFNDGQEESSSYVPCSGAKVGSRRVTVEDSPVIVNSPDHPVFNHPNSIGPADWAHWVQERGLYFLDVAGPCYLDLLTLEDPWEFNAGPKGGGLVVAEYGDGYWVYVGVGLFRQLPAGVPGAYRLLANLIALGS